MPKYKSILVGYINKDKTNPDKKYLSVKNVSEEQIIIEPGKSIFLNITPASIKESNPNIPDFSKSVKEDEEPY